MARPTVTVDCNRGAPFWSLYGLFRNSLVFTDCAKTVLKLVQT